MAESNQRTARAQKASKAQKAQSGAAKAKARQEGEALLRADTFTNAPKVSRRTLTKEEREALAKQREAETKEAEKIASAWSKGGLGRWWARLQSSPDKVTWGMAIVALGVVYGDIGTSPLYTAQTFLAGQGGLGSVDREAVLGMLSLVFWSITLITTVKYVLIAMRHRQQWRRRHLRTVLVDSQVRRMARDSRHARRRGIPRGFGTYPGGFHQFRSRRLADPAAIGRVVRRKPKPDPDDHRRDHRDSLLRAVARHRKHRQSIRLDGAGLVRLPRHRGRHESL